MDDSRIRRRALYTGQVQGVGFRYRTAETAQAFKVTGYVRNLPNGQVELTVEGDTAEVGDFLAAVGRRMQSCIERTEMEELPFQGEFAAFEIRR